MARHNRLVPMPEGFSFAPTRLAPFVFSPLFSLQGKLRMSLDIVLPRRKSKEDESVESFFKRRLGSEAFNLIVQPLVSGIYGANTENLSVRAARRLKPCFFAALWETLQIKRFRTETIPGLSALYTINCRFFWELHPSRFFPW